VFDVDVSRGTLMSIPFVFPHRCVDETI